MVLFLHNTSKVEGEPYPNLLKEKGGRGFPTLIFMDATGEVLTKQGERTVAGFQKTHRALDTLAKLEGKAKAGDKSVMKAIFVAKLDLGRFDLKEAKAKMKSLSFNDEQKTSINASLVELEFGEARKSAGRDSKALAKKVLEMHKAGRIPQGQYARTFWSTLLSHAQAEKDVKLFEEALPKYKAAMGDNPRYKRLLEYQDAVLEALKAGNEPPDRRAFFGTGAGRGAKKVIRR